VCGWVFWRGLVRRFAAVHVEFCAHLVLMM